MKLIIAATAVSIVVHIIGASIGAAPTAPTLDGGEVSGEIALGLGFADLVSGEMAGTAVTPDITTAAAPPETTAVSPAVTTAPVTQSKTLPAIAPALPETQTQTIKAAQPVQKPIEVTPQRVAAKAPPAPKPSAAKKGNAKVSTAKGQTTGTNTGRKAEASESKAKTAATKVGARALKSYHASIHRKISRVPKRSAGVKGNAYVGITIAGSGAITSVQIVKSSGHGAIDELALAQIKRAGPFAPTPSGTVMRVQVEFSSKS